MTPYPKHYLADVPHDLRMRVLDLCIHRQWHDALDLLNQNGFTQYEWYELVWFHDHAPTNLEPRSADSLSASDPALGLEPLSIPLSEISNLKCEIPPLHIAPASPGPDIPASSIEQPASDLLTLTRFRELRASVVKSSPVKPKRHRRPRSKACRLPVDVRLTLNTMLAGGCRYRDIIHSLNTRGHPGFNKANLNAWKRTGFQDWLRSQNLPTPEDAQKVSRSCTEALGSPQKAPEGDRTFSQEGNSYE